MAITTIDNIKAVLQIEDTSKDLTISAMIPMIEEFVKDYCNNDFIDGFPKGLELSAIRMIAFNLFVKPGITKQAIGDVEVDYEPTYPADILSNLNKYRKMRF